MIQISQFSTTHNVSFKFNKYTHEKIKTHGNCYKMDTLRVYKCLINVSFNLKEKTVLIGNTKYNILVDYKCGYAYKKLKGNNILVSSFDNFINFIKDASNKNDVFHFSVSSLLTQLSKNNFTVLN